MECRQVIELVIDNDNHEELPAAVVDHMKTCEKCRRQADLFQGTLLALQGSIAASEDAALTQRIMDKVRKEALSVKREAEEDLPPVRFRSWVVAGAVMLAGIFGLRFSNWMADLRSTVGPSVEIATGLVLGLLLTGYLCMLVVSNLDKVTRLFRHR